MRTVKVIGGWLVVAGLAHLAATGFVGLAQDAKAPVAKSRSVALNPASLQVYADAQKRTDDARKAVEASSAWKDLVISQNQEQSALLYVMAENGIRPSDGCQPMAKDGKLLTAGGVLDHFDCPAPAPPKPPEVKK